MFSDVTRNHGFLETITVHFEGSESQILGQVDAFAKRNDFSHYSAARREPGSRYSMRVNKRVEMGDDKNNKTHGQYRIHHTSAAAAGPEQAAGGPGGTYTDCEGEHDLLFRVVPRS